MKNNKIINIIIFIILLLGMSIFPYIPLRLFHINLDNLSTNMKILYQFICDIGYMVIVYFLYHKELFKDIKDIKVNYKNYLPKAFKYYFIGLAIMYISNFLIGLLFSEATPNNEEMVRTLIDSYPLYMLFSVSIYAPFIEEIIFRKSIRNIINNKYLYIIISGLIFSAMHVLGIVNNNLDYLYIIPYLGLGCAFALIYYKTDNIFTTIILHSLHNTLAIIVYLMAGV